MVTNINGTIIPIFIWELNNKSRDPIHNIKQTNEKSVMETQSNTSLSDPDILGLKIT